MSERKLSARAVLGLCAALVLLFSAALLLSAGSFLPGETAPVTADAPPERLLAGRNDPEQPALELLPGERVNINTASVPELKRLPGIGDVLAAAIVDYREQHGPFRSVEELLEVPDIGEGRFEKIKENVTVGPD